MPATTRFALAGLLAAALLGGAAGRGLQADEPAAPTPPPRSKNAWTLDEALEKLKLSPRDTYLQYVVLQLARREARAQDTGSTWGQFLQTAAQQARVQEIADTVEKLAFGGDAENRRGRRDQVDLFGLFAGALAVQEGLQLDTMRGRPAVLIPAPTPEAEDPSNSASALPGPPPVSGNTSPSPYLPTTTSGVERLSVLPTPGAASPAQVTDAPLSPQNLPGAATPASAPTRAAPAADAPAEPDNSLLMGAAAGALVGSAVSAPKAEPEQQSNLPPKTYMNKNPFFLPVSVDDRTRGNLKEFQLYVKDDPARPWALEDRQGPRTTNFQFRPPQDGEYWFMVVTVDKKGRQTPADVAHESPQVIVVFDTQSPVVDLGHQQTTPVGLLIHCQIRDVNRDRDRERFEYQASDKQWYPGMTSGDPDTFYIPAHANPVGKVRITAADRAGNQVTREFNLKETSSATSGLGLPSLLEAVSGAAASSALRALEAEAPAKATVPPPSRDSATGKMYTRCTVFNLPIKLDDRARASLKQVILYVKVDDAPWQAEITAPATAHQFKYRAKHDGEYWFSVQTVDRNGVREPRDVSKVAPNLMVVVDTQPPTIELQRVTLPGGRESVGCLLQDSNPDCQSIKIDYRTPDGKSHPLELVPSRPGFFRLPESAAVDGTVRVTASDRAGNQTRREVNLKELTGEGPCALPDSDLGAVDAGLEGALKVALDGAEECAAKQTSARAVAPSPSLEEIVAMKEAGVANRVIINAVRLSPVGYSLSAANIIWLTKKGLGEVIISEMQTPTLTPAAEVSQPAPVVVPQSEASPPAVSPADSGTNSPPVYGSFFLLGLVGLLGRPFSLRRFWGETMPHRPAPVVKSIPRRVGRRAGMQTLRVWLCGSLAVGLVLLVLAGCQTSVAEEGQTLPSGWYLQHLPQYNPPTPPFPLENEQAALQDAAAAATEKPAASAEGNSARSEPAKQVLHTETVYEWVSETVVDKDGKRTTRDVKIPVTIYPIVPITSGPTLPRPRATQAAPVPPPPPPPPPPPFGPLSNIAASKEAQEKCSPFEKIPWPSVHVADLTGPTIKSHLWQKMLAGRTPKVSYLARCVPHNFYFVEFRSVAKLLDLIDSADQWSTFVYSQSVKDARSQKVARRVQKQLALETGKIPGAFCDLAIEGLALTGSDLFIREGSDVTVLLKLRQEKLFKQCSDKLLARAEQSHPDAKRVTGKLLGVDYVQIATPDRAISVFAAYPRPGLHVRSNSKVGLRRVLEAVRGTTASGKAVKRLGDTDEFKYVRTLMPAGAKEEDGFVYLSDAFVRHMVGPRLKLTELRRLQAYNHLRMIAHASQFYRTEQGKAPESLEALAAADCCPGKFNEGALTAPDGGVYSLAADGASGICARHGTVRFLTPCCEIPVKEATGTEAAAYKAFLDGYNQYWRTYFDPIAIRVQVQPKRVRLETIVLPLLDNTVYTMMSKILGGPAEHLDKLPVPKRNIFSLNVRLNKEAILKEFGPMEPKDLEAMVRVAARQEGKEEMAEFAGNAIKFLTKGVGNQVGLHVYDQGVPFDLNLATFLGRMMGSFSGGGDTPDLTANLGVMAIAVPVAACTAPGYLSFTVKNEKIVDDFLGSLDKLIPPLAAQLSGDVGFALEGDYYKLTLEGGVVARSFALRVGPARFRVHLARIGKGLYLTNHAPVLEDIQAAAKAEEVQRVDARRDGGKFRPDHGPKAHALVRMRARNWNLALPGFRLSWAENNRQSCLCNLAPLSGIARSLAAQPPDEAVLETDSWDDRRVQEYAAHVYGTHHVCPDGGRYVLAADGKSVVCTVHGSALDSRQKNVPAADSPTARLMRDFQDLSAALTFTPEGLRAVLTIDRK